ncbi:MAG: hypothetical protein NT024_02400 [Proteobacteria bacterium]|nr:hypothetical protein [Pseudomonadota bacterium]
MGGAKRLVARIGVRGACNQMKHNAIGAIAAASNQYATLKSPTVRIDQATMAGAINAPRPKQKCSALITPPTRWRYDQSSNVLTPTSSVAVAAPINNIVSASADRVRIDGTQATSTASSATATASTRWPGKRSNQRPLNSEPKKLPTESALNKMPMSPMSDRVCRASPASVGPITANASPRATIVAKYPAVVANLLRRSVDDTPGSIAQCGADDSQTHPRAQSTVRPARLVNVS